MLKELYLKSIKLAGHKNSKFFLAKAIGIIIISGGIGKKELSANEITDK